MRECNIEKNLAVCSCSNDYPCSMKGVCCECMRKHWRDGEFPACFFPPDIERTFDRSIERFIDTYKKRGRWW
ncbi:MAG: hypothetical protein JXA79_08245 [Deltaproteobacteria bacterium]|nr:hypothetical protein [Deltaproteobacteria bacterium]